MLLSHKTTVKVNTDYANIIGHMCYAAYKLWNICNYERLHYKELGLSDYPDWYYQKKHHKDNLWYKQLPSQTAQEVCKLLDKSWRSFYSNMKSGKMENPNPPRFKHEGIAITYMQNGIEHSAGSETVRLTISAGLKHFMSEAYDVHEPYLYLENQLFRNMDVIKQFKIYPPVDGECCIIVIYEVQDVKLLPDNGKVLSIDAGVHNFLTCLDSETGESFIVGRKYLSICRYYSKETARVQSQWYRIQSSKGVRYPKSSRHIKRLYRQRDDAVLDYLHKMTRYIVTYCKEHDIRTVVMGDITGIRKDKDYGNITNQNLHSLPYKKIFILLEYKLAAEGIRFVKRKEVYSSQCSPFAPEVSTKYAVKKNRVRRGLYQDGTYTWNADCVGAYNILRLYLSDMQKPVLLSPQEIRIPYVAKVAA